MLLNEAPYLLDVKLACAACQTKIRYVDYCYEKLTRIGYNTKDIRALYLDFCRRVASNNVIPVPCPHCGKINICKPDKETMRLARNEDKALVDRYIPDESLLVATEHHVPVFNFQGWISQPIDEGKRK